MCATAAEFLLLCSSNAESVSLYQRWPLIRYETEIRYVTVGVWTKRYATNLRYVLSASVTEKHMVSQYVLRQWSNWSHWSRFVHLAHGIAMDGTSARLTNFEPDGASIAKLPQFTCFILSLFLVLPLQIIKSPTDDRKAASLFRHLLSSLERGGNLRVTGNSKKNNLKQTCVQIRILYKLEFILGLRTKRVYRESASFFYTTNDPTRPNSTKSNHSLCG